ATAGRPGRPAAVRCGRVEDPCTRRGQARRQAVGRAAQARGPAAAGRMADVGLALVGQSLLTAARALAWGAPPARASARRLVLEEVERWQSWSEPPHRLAAPEPPRPERLETRAQRVAQETAPDPAGGPGARRLTTPVAPARPRDLASMWVTGPQRPTGWRVSGRARPCPAAAGAAGAVRAPCPTAQRGHGSSLRSRAAEPCPQRLRPTSKTTRGRAALRTRP